MNADTGAWAILESRQSSWLQGLTGRAKPPRDNFARQRRQLLALAIAWGLAGAGAMRLATPAPANQGASR